MKRAPIRKSDLRIAEMAARKPIEFKVDPLAVACVACGEAAGLGCLARVPRGSGSVIDRLSALAILDAAHSHPIRIQRAAQDQCPRVSVYVSGDDIRKTPGLGPFMNEGWYDHALLKVDYGEGNVTVVPHWIAGFGATGVWPRLWGIGCVRGVDAVSLLGRLVEDE